MNANIFLIKLLVGSTIFFINIYLTKYLQNLTQSQ